MGAKDREQTAVVRTALHVEIDGAASKAVSEATSSLARRLDAWAVSASWGSVLAFERPLDAVRMAVAVQRGALERQTNARVAVHLTEIFVDADGAGGVGEIPEAVLAGLVKLARPGQTLLTRGAFDLARRAAVGEPERSGSWRWESHGIYELEALDEPLELFEVGEEQVAVFLPPSGSEGARKVVRGAQWQASPGAQLPARPNWRLVRRLWTAAGGATWRAEHIKTGDVEAFTLGHDVDCVPDLQREVTVSRVLREALGEHGGACRILDWSFDDLPYFIEWELPDGGTLADWSEARGGLARVPWPTRVRLAARLAELIAALHSRGVVHGSLSAECVLIATGRDGAAQPVIARFANSRILDTARVMEHQITMAGVLPEPMPEVEGLDVEAAAVTPASDVRALAVLVRQLLTGDLEGDVDDASMISQGLAPELVAVIRDATADPPRVDAAVLSEQLRAQLEPRREATQPEASGEQVSGSDGASTPGGGNASLVRWIVLGGVVVILIALAVALTL